MVNVMKALAIEGFYTLCLRDALRPLSGSAPSLERAASDLAMFARMRGIDQTTVLAELETASKAVEWVTSFEAHVHTQAVTLGQRAIQQAYAALPENADLQSPGASPERPRFL